MNTVIVTVKLDRFLPEPPSIMWKDDVMDSYIGFCDRDTDEEYYIENQSAEVSQIDSSSNIDNKIKVKYGDCVLRKWDGKHGEEVEFTEELWNKLEPATYLLSLIERSGNKVYANAEEAKIKISFGNFKKEYITEGEPYWLY